MRRIELVACGEDSAILVKALRAILVHMLSFYGDECRQISATSSMSDECSNE